VAGFAAGRIATVLISGGVMLGTVKWFDVKKGFGFILNAEGRDVFVHYSCIDGGGFRTLKDGEKVEYEQQNGGKGLHAVHVRRLQPAPVDATS
jgi:cold shock protein